MAIGRNDPCPCGSGKKYKRCCIRKDQEAKRVQRSMEWAQRVVGEPESPTPSEQPAPPPPDPEVEALNTLWTEFREQNYEGQITLFLETLDDEERMDDEMAFDMLSTIYGSTVEHDERDRFGVLVDMLRERLPEVYAQSAPYCLNWRITNALVAGRFDIKAFRP